MSSPDLPLNRAHQHAANAEDHWNNGLLVLAAEEHARAAKAYLAAVERSHDESARRTLQMLYAKHCKAGKELRRKIEKLEQEGKDPHLPYKQERPLSPLLRGPQVVAEQNIQHSTPESPPNRPIIDTVDESFMLLGGQRVRTILAIKQQLDVSLLAVTVRNKSDPGDAFNQFWNIMQGMLDNLSQPVAFATVPLMIDGTSSPSGIPKSSLHRHKNDDNNTSDTEVEEHTSHFSNGQATNHEVTNSSMDRGDRALYSDDFEDVADFLEEDEMSGSFCLVSTHTSPGLAFLKRENASLKAEAQFVRKRLEAMERVIRLRKEQDLHLRDSIFQATREAQRVMSASTMASRPGVDSGGPNLNMPPMPSPSLTNGREAQYMRRVKELEEEVRNLRTENDKNKAMITKYRERWEKLKESAKRKKEAKTGVAAAFTNIKEGIVEVPEVEEQLDLVEKT